MCFGVWCQWSSSLAGKYSPKPALVWIEFGALVLCCGLDRVWCSGALMLERVWCSDVDRVWCSGALMWIEFGALMWIESGVDRVCCG